MKLAVFFLLILISSKSFGQEKKLYKFQSKNGKIGFIDKKGQIKINPDFLFAHDFNEGLAFVSKNHEEIGYDWICIDTLGNEVFHIYNRIPESNFYNGLARISNFSEHWFINCTGKKVFNKSFTDGIGGFEKGCAMVKDSTKEEFYWINLKGEVIESPNLGEFQEKERTDCNLYSYEESNLFGFKNSIGEIVIQAKFITVDKFENGVCAVQLNKPVWQIAGNRYFDTLINLNGEILIEKPMYSYLGFQGELIQFYTGPHFSGQVQYLNEFGELIKVQEK